MKLKTATLIALISACVLALLDGVHFGFGWESFYSRTIYLIRIVSWLGIANFFYSLYKNQK